MSSSFKGLDLFGSGPHRFVDGRRGHLVTVDFFGGGGGGGSTAQGVIDWKVEVRGRLVAGSESALRALRAAIVAQVELNDPPVPGTLVGLTGHSYAGLSLVAFEETGPVDRGRVWSVAYVAEFQKV